MRRRVAAWEIAGVFWIFVAGSALHFAYDWLGRVAPVGLVAAVNESIWEHLKLAYWPAVLYALAEHAFLKGQVRNLLLAKAAATCLMPLTIVALFYGYTAVLGHNVLWADISIFFVAAAAGQLVSYVLLTARDASRPLNLVGLAALLLLGAAFMAFTFAPPHLPIFRDAVTGSYGIR